MTSPVAIGPAYTTRSFFAQNVSSTAVALSGISEYTLDVNKQNVMWLTASADLRYRYDGSSPTTGVGHLYLAAGSPLQLFGKKRILDFRFIGNGGSASIVSVTLDNTANSGGIV
jgi:hypothetical protein